MAEQFHQISAFVAAKSNGIVASAAYSVYDCGKQQILRCASIKGISEHRALLMAVWSAVRFCKDNMPMNMLSVYGTDEIVTNELNAIWFDDKSPSDYDDADRMESIIEDCIWVYQVNFATFPMNDNPDLSNGRIKMLEVLNLVNEKR